MINPKSAGFILRFLASLVESALWFLPHSLFWLFIVNGSSDLTQFAHNIALYLILVFLPIITLAMFYVPFSTTYLGGNIGKLITGLRVINIGGGNLSLRRSLFRHTIGYQFSGLLFGLGFFAIIKDKEKLGWHDKATGSRVVTVQNLWPLALLLLVGLIATNYFILAATVNNYKSGPLKPEVENLFGAALENVGKNSQKDKQTVPIFTDEAGDQTLIIQSNTRVQVDNNLSIAASNFRNSTAAIAISFEQNPSQDTVERVQKDDEIKVNGYLLEILDITPDNAIKIEVIKLTSPIDTGGTIPNLY